MNSKVNTKRILTFLLSVIVTMLILYSCQEGTKKKSSAKVTALLDLSAHYADYGKETKNAMELALQEVDNITVDFFDCKSENDTALDYIDKLDSSTSIVISFTSWVSNAIAPTAETKKLLQFVIASAVFKYDTLPSCVRFTVDVKTEVNFLVNYLQQYDSIAIIYTDNEYGTGWKNSLQSQLGDKVIAVESYDNQTTDYTLQLSNISKVKPEALILISFGEASEIIRQAKKMNISSQLIGTRPIYTKELLKEPLAEGLVFSYPALNEKHPFYTKFKEKYGSESSVFGAEGYDLIISLSEAIKEKGSNPEDIALWYKDRTYQGALGEIKFNQYGLADYKFCLKQVKNRNIISY
jgi:branched-chain amino acid transport system substrate-binding protein